MLDASKLPLKVLYVEDDDAIRATLLKLLKRTVHTVWEASNGMEGFELFKKHLPDLVITDIQMPVMTGLELSQKIKQLAPHTHIIVVTAYNETDYLRDILEIGVDRYLTKPIDFQKLRTYLQEASEIALAHDLIKEQEKLLREYRYVIDSGTIVSKTDLEGNITFVNDLFAEISGYSREELLGKNHNIVRHPDVPHEIFEDLWNHLHNGLPWHGQVKNRKKNGDFYVVDARIVPIFDEQGQVVEYMGIRHDITKSIMQEQAIDEEKILSQTIMDEQPNIVCFTTKEDGLLSVNQAFFRYFPYQNFESFRTDHNCICELFIEEEGYLFNTSTHTWLDTIFERPLELHKAKMKDRDNKVRVFSVLAKEIMREGKSFYVITFTDMSNMQESIDAAIAANHAKTNFLASMSHEIRTPLNGIIGFLSLLSQTSLDNSQKEYLNIIQTSSQSLLSIINDILDLSKVENGAIELENIAYDPFVEYDKIVQLYKAKAMEKNILFTAIIDQSIPHSLLGDPLRTKQVLANLVSNAIKFTPQSGKIELSINPIAQNESTVSLCFSIKDSGIGITEEQQKIIFNPFSQADNSISRQFGGTGLGLSISKSLIEQMGGSIDVQSTINEGSEFYFVLHLPYNHENTSTKVLKQKEYSSTLHLHGDVLVVDDNTVNQKLIEIILKQYNLNVTLASNGEEALRCVEHSKFDLIFMDIHMPIMDGIEATAHLLSREKKLSLPHTPIVALTANALKGDKERFLGAGMDDYLSKPIIRDELDGIINKFLSSQHESVKGHNKQISTTKQCSLDLEKTATELGIDVHTVYMLIDDFLKSSVSDLKQLIAAIDERDITNIKEYSHKIKGIAGSLRLHDVTEHAKTIEINAKENLDFDYIEEFCYLLQSIDAIEVAISNQHVLTQGK